MMTMVLWVSNSRFANSTGLFAGILVTLYIAFEDPLSGMSMNPARTFGSALPAWRLSDLWIYFTAPVVGMFAAAETYLFMRGAARVACAKFHHDNSQRCLFCEYKAARASTEKK
jgi:aquaporin Z